MGIFDMMGGTSEAIVLIATQLPTYSALTIFPYDDLTDVVMLEGHNIKVEDIRVRQQVTPEFLKADPEAGADLINNLMTQVKRLEHEVEQRNRKASNSS